MNIQWETSEHPVDYEAAMARMEQRVADIHAGTASELVWLLEHPPLYTAGTSAKTADLLAPQFPVYQTGRGGQYTYHGPGQRVAYVMMDLRREFRVRSSEFGDIPLPNSTPDLRRYVQQLEEWVILTLAEFGIRGELREGRVGVWVVDKSSEFRVQRSKAKEQRPAGRPSLEPSPIANDSNREQGQSERPAGRPSLEPSPIANDSNREQGQLKESKIAALGIRVRRGIAFHGIALNVNPDLSHYAGIVPCGIREHGVTSLHALGIMASMTEVDAALKQCFERVFGNR